MKNPINRWKGCSLKTLNINHSNANYYNYNKSLLHDLYFCNVSLYKKVIKVNFSFQKNNGQNKFKRVVKWKKTRSQKEEQTI